MKKPALGLAVLLLCASAAGAETIQLPTGKVVLAQDQLLMIQGTTKAVQGYFEEAELLYTQAIAANGANVQAWLQRGITRRELKNRAGMEQDAVQVLNLTGQGLHKNPNDAALLYARGYAYRLMRDFPKARADIQQAMALKPQNASWQQDLQAIDLEEKMN